MKPQYRIGFRQAEQVPPPPRPHSPGLVERYEGHPEIDPALMGDNVSQMAIPEWDFRRIVDNREEYIRDSQSHWTDERLSGEAVIAELRAENLIPPTRGGDG